MYCITIIEVFPPVKLDLLLATTTSFYPKSLFPRCSNDGDCLRWRKARTYLGIPEYACETTGSARRQPDHIHICMNMSASSRQKYLRFWLRREPVPNRYAAQETDALQLSHDGSPQQTSKYINTLCCNHINFKVRPYQWALLEAFLISCRKTSGKPILFRSPQQLSHIPDVL